MTKMNFLILLILSSLLNTGCSYFANRPLETLEYKNAATFPSKNLFVFMRGLGGNHHSFADAAMVEDVIKRSIPYDMIAPNAHFAYYSERTLIKRLHEDVILPAVQKGYTNIWLIGVSMGGLGSMLYIKEQPEHISGVFLIAPFLGYDKITQEILDSQGVSGWNPGKYDPDDDWERMFWHWVKEDVATKKGIPIFLGFGEDDEYSTGQNLLAAVLPENRVMRIQGAHDIKTIKSLWSGFLERGLYTTLMK